MVIKTSYSIFTLIGLLLFFITFLYTKSYTLSNVHETLVANSQKLLDSGSQEVTIELTKEQLIVDDEYYVRVEFIKSYSIATQKIIKELKFMRFVYVIGFMSFVFSFLISIFIIFL